MASLFESTVLRYDGRTGAFTGTFVDAGQGGLNGADGLVFGPDGNLYVSSYFGNNVLRYDGTTGGFRDVFASGGGLDGPAGLKFGPDGNLYVVSNRNNSVLRYDGRTGAFLDVVVPPASGGLSNPIDLVFAPSAVVPEPTGLILMSLAAASLLGYRGWRKGGRDVLKS